MIHTDNDIKEFYGKLGDIERMTSKNQFLRIHRSYLINYEHITKISKKEIVMKDCTILNIGETYEKKVKNYLLQ